MFRRLKRLTVGAPFATADEHHQRLGKSNALAVPASRMRAGPQPDPKSYLVIEPGTDLRLMHTTEDELQG